MRVAICWTEFAGYTAACWRELASRAGVDLRILAWPSNLSRSGTQFDRALVSGLPVRFLEGAEQQDRDLVARLVAEHNPEVLMIGGWAEPPYRALANDARLASARLVLAMDTPWKGTLRQRLARLKIGSFIDRLDGIFVPGQLGQRFARHLRMPEDRNFTGMLGFDLRLFENVLDRRLSAPWPRNFVYLGRYSIEKALDVLLAGYARYRAAEADPWPLACYGSGPMRRLLEGQVGVEVNDWVQPPDQPDVLLRHGVSVLTSRTEAWGVAVAEAMASGLPAICSNRVGAVPDLIQPEQNGLVIPANDPGALAGAMRWMHDHHDHLPEMGRLAREAAAPYSAQRWADRFEAMARATRVAGEAIDLASPAMHYCFLTVSTLDAANLIRAREMGRALIHQGVRVSYIVEDHPINRAFKDLDPAATVEYVTDPRKLGQFARRRKLLKQLRPDFVEVLNPHPKTLLPIWSPIEGTRVVAMWDEPMFLKPLGVLKRIYEERLAKSLIRRAAFHFAATQTLGQKLKERYGIEAIYMPHAAYLPQYPPVTSPFDHPTAVYMGNLYPLFDHDVIFDAANLLAQEGKKPPIVVIGHGPEQEKWQRFIDQHHLENVKLLGYLSGVELWRRLRHAQVLLFPIRDTLTNLTRCPSKTFAYAQARRPTITNLVGEVARVLGDKATYIECTPQAFARAIEQAMSGPLSDVDFQVERQNWDDRAATLIRALSAH